MNKYRIKGKDGEHEFEVVFDNGILRFVNYPNMEVSHTSDMIGTANKVIEFLNKCHLNEFSVKAID